MTTVRLLAAALAAILLAAPALAQRQVDGAGDPWVHKATGTPFPARLGEFQRVSVYEYSQDGRDASAGYRLERGDQQVTVTFFVFPVISDWTCEQTFDDVKANVAGYEGAKLLRSTSVAAPLGKGGNDAMLAQYSLPTGSMKIMSGPVRSDAYLYCPKDTPWLVKYRATGTEGFDFTPDVEALMHAIRWPEKLGG